MKQKGILKWNVMHPTLSFPIEWCSDESSQWKLVFSTLTSMSFLDHIREQQDYQRHHGEHESAFRLVAVTWSCATVMFVYSVDGWLLHLHFHYNKSGVNMWEWSCLTKCVGIKRLFSAIFKNPIVLFLKKERLHQSQPLKIHHSTQRQKRDNIFPKSNLQNVF